MATSSVSSTTSTTTTPSTSSATSTSTSTNAAKPNIVSALGAGSGMDVKALAGALVDAVKQPQADAINKKIDKANARISGYSALRYGLDQLKTAFNALNNPSDFNSVTLSNNKSDFFTASANTNATAGNHTISVSALASPQTSQSALTDNSAIPPTAIIVSDPAAATGGLANTSLTLTFPQKSGADQTKTIQISGDDSLNGIAANINSANVGLSANVVFINAAQGYKLVVTGESGTANQFSLTSPAVNGTASKLSFSTVQGQTAADAQITVDGLTLTRSSNQINDAIPGVTLNLLATTATTTGSGGQAVTTDAPGKLSLQRDVSQIKTNVQTLVSAYNDLASILKDASDPKSKVDLYGASLVGDSIVDSIKTQVRDMFTKDYVADATGSIKALRDIGVSVNSTGQMQLDANKLDTSLSSSFKDVVTMLSNNTPDSSYVTSSTKAGVAGDAVQQLTAILDSAHGDQSGILFVNSANSNKQIQSYQDDLQKLSDRMDALLARYNKQFSAMDSIVGQSKSLATSLTSTFANMSKNNGN